MSHRLFVQSLLVPQRAVEKRDGSKALPLKWTVNLEAVLAQAVGEEAGTVCNHCSRGDGAFLTCLTADGKLKGSCAACHANNSRNRCSLRPRQSKRSRNGGNDDDDDDDDNSGRSLKKRNTNQQTEFQFRMSGF